MPKAESIQKKIRGALRKQLGYVARDIRYLDGFMNEEYALERKEIALYLTIHTLYEQQKYMYDTKMHLVDRRIVKHHTAMVASYCKGKSKSSSGIWGKT